MESIQPYLDYFSQNPGWAIALIFLIAFGEALLIIGLFVPSTAVLVGAGMLVGTGHLGFWEVFAATAVGAILGDQLSYWAGRLFGDRLKTMWPLSLYPSLVANGETFVRKHGGKSIAIGRFVPGVKAVVPGIVGMFGMGQVSFAAINFSSGIFWALCHIFPGMLAGQMLALAGQLSERLLIVLLVLIAILFAAGWLIRLGVIGLVPWIRTLQHAVYDWSLTRREKGYRRLGRALAPKNPRAITVIVLGLVASGALVWFALIAHKALTVAVLSNTDISVHGLMEGLRNAPADQLMIAITMLGDRPILLALGGVIALWLFWRRAWRTGLAAVVALLAAEASVDLLKAFVARPRPGIFEGLATLESFPSSHATFAAVSFGMLAVIASQPFRRWGRALVHAACGLAALTIAYTRIYLGVHWLSDVLAGLLIGAAIAAVFGIAIEAVPQRRLRPLSLTALALAVFAAAGAYHVAGSYGAQAARYAEASSIVRLRLAGWQAGQWASVPRRRVDLAGRPEELFAAQWVGDTGTLGATLAAAGWSPSPRWTWREALPYLDPARALADLLPRPALHEGKQAELTFTLPVEGREGQRLVIRVWRTEFEIDDGQTLRPLNVVSVTRDRLRRGLSLYAVPVVVAADGAEIGRAVATLSKAPGTAMLVAAGGGNDGVTLLLAGH